jgi:hypothetical protein
MAGRVVAFRLYIDWNFDGAFTDESAHLESARGDMRLAPPDEALTGSGGIIASMSLTLRNPDGRFSPLRTDGALYTMTRNGGGYHAPCYLEISVDGGSNFHRVFTGVLKLPSESTLTSKANPMVTYEVRSLEEQFLQRRVSLPQAQFAAIHDDGLTESDILGIFLSAVGVAAGDMVMSPGLFKIAWAWLDDESGIEECWALASACGGRVYADPNGVFRYESLAHWQVAQRSIVSQFAFTRDDFGRVDVRYDDTDLYNVVTVEASPRAAGGVDVVWESEALHVVEPGATKVITARFDAPAYTITGLQFEAYDAGGGGQTAVVSITPTYYAQRADLSVVNSSALQVHLRPLRIVGRPVVGGPELEETRTSATNGSNSAFFVARGTTRTRSMRGNPYIQSAVHAGMVAEFVLQRSEYPRVAVRITGAQGQPAMRLSDRITVVDSPTMTSGQACYVVGIEWSLSLKGGFTQNIDAVQTASMYPYDNNYFVVGTHTVGGTRRVFY